MQIKGVSNAVDSINYNNSNINGTIARKVGTKMFSLSLLNFK